MSAICGTSRGRYTKPIPMTEVKVNWVDEENNFIEPPQKHSCEHDNHWQWGKGTRNGQKLNFPINEMFYQKWDLTKKELREAIDAYDMFSLDMPAKIICKECADKELNNPIGQR